MELITSFGDAGMCFIANIFLLFFKGKFKKKIRNINRNRDGT